MIQEKDWSDELWNWKVKWGVQVARSDPFPRRFEVELPSGVDACLGELYVTIEELDETILHLQKKLAELRGKYELHD